MRRSSFLIPDPVIEPRDEAGGDGSGYNGVSLSFQRPRGKSKAEVALDGVASGAFLVSQLLSGFRFMGGGRQEETMLSGYLSN